MHLRSPLIDAVNLALLVTGNTETALTLVFGDHYDLEAALGQNILSDLLREEWKVCKYVSAQCFYFSAFINGYHPGIKGGQSEFVYEDEMDKAFSRCLYYLQNSATDYEDEHVSQIGLTREEDEWSTLVCKFGTYDALWTNMFA